ncbi:MAG: polymer-forming cytoskeletal protein [Desulfobacteraceae bacterium]|nr:polymer-forming cytoskeletal protein [Desulfobacteraceae bacterium]
MKKNKKPDTISTLLGMDTIVDGTLEFSDTIRLDGKVKGKITSREGTLIVGEKAVIEAEISVGMAIIKGEVSGRMEARDSIQIHAPAKITGDIHAPSISIDSGVIFNGNCSMEAQPAAQKKFMFGRDKNPESQVPEPEEKKSKNLDN